MDLLLPDEEARLARAVRAYRGGLYSLLNKAAIDMVVPYKKLQRRAKDIPSRSTNGGHNKHFSRGQEKVLTDWIDRLIQSGFPPRLDFIRDRANLLLAAQQDLATTSLCTVGKKWPQNFIARHPQYKITNGIPLDLARSSCSSHATLNTWFHKFKGAQHEFCITTDDIYNVDETGFQTGVSQRTKLVTWKITPPSRIYACIREIVPESPALNALALPAELFLHWSFFQDNCIKAPGTKLICPLTGILQQGRQDGQTTILQCDG